MIQEEEKKDIRKCSLDELGEFFVSNGEKAFRSKQVYEWLWKKSATSFDEMTNLSKKTRSLLIDNFIIKSVKIKQQQKSYDGTIKIIFELHDGKIVEGVMIPSEKRATACISSQVGCALGCTFCATGKLGFTRNLDFDEIYDQVALISKLASEELDLKLSNIVYMGMGEPLLNYDNVMKSIDIITSENGLAMSPQRITVSTAGISKMIKQLGDDNIRFNLAISLHTANNNKRNEIMPINKQNSITELIEAIKYFHEKTNNRITFEYILFKNYNDSIDDANELAAFCKNFPVKINVIEYNKVIDTPFRRADKLHTEEFVKLLESKNLIVNVRRSRGKDIDAACGQLANKISV
ncbi:MAG: 23S rRNA (adenine(2503)-C(2))-methyltransferase RlmN [Bacteroidales bacterium]|nr:23S rRNA (adenine(2503)-C(2))-methyltransferase RlmN [Bacteroidales bacterium]